MKAGLRKKCRIVREKLSIMGVDLAEKKRTPEYLWYRFDSHRFRPL